MARGEHHRIHAHDRVRRNRHRVAQEAARLMSEHGIRDYRHAKVKAAERLGVIDEQSLPRNREIVDALRVHQRLFQADSQPQALRDRRAAALAAMDFLEPFTPRLVGAALDGTADAHTPVCLHVFSDDADAPSRFLYGRGIAHDTGEQRMRMRRDLSADVPVLHFVADELAFELSILPVDALRQAPLDRIDDRPMPRATRAQVKTLLAPADDDTGAAD